MRPVNLYLLTRDMDKNTYTEFENILSARKERMQIKEHEFGSLRRLVDILQEKGVTIAQLDGFFYSYTIRQIGKEFDLLKIDAPNRVLNIELKSMSVTEEKIERQLLKNKYYLGTLADRLDMYTYVEETDSLYTLQDNVLKKAEFSELVCAVKSFSEYGTDNPDKLLQAKNYLISPLNMPKEFLEGRYFLTQQQEMIKKNICESLSDENSCTSYWGITGIAGTGKTLIMYDLAKEMSKTGKVLLIHCGILSDGHRMLNDMMENVDIISGNDICGNSFERNHLNENSLSERSLNENSLCRSSFGEMKIVQDRYQFLLIDEAQRMSENALEFIKSVTGNGIKICIFSYDYFQILSKTEQRRNIPARIATLPGFTELKLSGRIRSNREMNSFIQTLLDLRERDQNHIYQYENVDVLFAKDDKEAAQIINFYRNERGYTFIEYDDPIKDCPGDINVLETSGMEFEDVIITLTDHFKYSDEGVLMGNAHPNPDYSYYRLLFQSVSRTRERLCIVVVGDGVLFGKVLGIQNRDMK